MLAPNPQICMRRISVVYSYGHRLTTLISSYFGGARSSNPSEQFRSRTREEQTLESLGAVTGRVDS